MSLVGSWICSIPLASPQKWLESQKAARANAHRCIIYGWCYSFSRQSTCHAHVMWLITRRSQSHTCHPRSLSNLCKFSRWLKQIKDATCDTCVQPTKLQTFRVFPAQLSGITKRSPNKVLLKKQHNTIRCRYCISLYPAGNNIAIENCQCIVRISIKIGDFP